MDGDHSSCKHSIASRLQSAHWQHDLWPLAAGLTMVLIAVKGILLPFSVATPGEFARWLLRLALVSASDICFLAGLTAVCALALWMTHRAKIARRIWRPTLYGVFYLAGLYGVLAVPMYRVTMWPFSIRMMSFAGGPVLMASSIEMYVTWPLVASLAFVPLALLLLPRLSSRLPRPVFSPRLRLPSAVVAGLATVLYGTVSHTYIEAHWQEPHRWERRISQSPHAVLLASCLEELFRPDPFAHSGVVDEIDDADFRPRREQARVPDPNTILPSALLSRRPKNVIVFLLESSGAEYLGVHGAKFDTTPHLARLAAEQGVVFENAYVQVPNSCKSLVSLLSSIYPRPDWKLIVRDMPGFAVPTLPQVLGEGGYRTCLLHSGDWSWNQRDKFLRERGAQTLIDASNLPAPRINSWGVSDKAMFQAALNWIDSARDKPFFLLAYTIETHHPYAQPEKPLDFNVPDREFNAYLNALRATDERIGRFVEELARRGLDESTLVVVTTDHGESFGQHNQREHMFGIYQPNVHIPIVLLHPALRDAPQKRISAVREQIDLAPTILDVVGLPVPGEWQGRNLFRSDEDRPAYFFCVGNHVVLGLRQGPLKYHYYVASGQEELFDLAADPAEDHNLAADRPEQCESFRRRVGGLVDYQRKYLARHGAP